MSRRTYKPEIKARKRAVALLQRIARATALPFFRKRELAATLMQANVRRHQTEKQQKLERQACFSCEDARVPEAAARVPPWRVLEAWLSRVCRQSHERPQRAARAQASVKIQAQYRGRQERKASVAYVTLRGTRPTERLRHGRWH